MLDVKGLVSEQGKGDHLLRTLAHDEEIILQNYALVAARELTKTGMADNQSTNNIILNAFQAGLALGLGIQIAGGKVLARPRT